MFSGQANPPEVGKECYDKGKLTFCFRLSETAMKLFRFFRNDWTVSLLLVAALIAARGLFLANVIRGRYAISSMLADIALACGLVVILRLLNTGLQKLLDNRADDAASLPKLLAQTARCLILTVIAGPFFLTTFQLRPPKIGCLENPASRYGLDYSDVTLETEDGLQLAAWHVPAEQPGRPILVITHGLGANKDNFLITMKLAHEAGYDALLYDARAHGDSQGSVCSLGVHEAKDVKAAYDWAARKFPGRPIYAWGNSVGGAGVLRAAAEYGIFEKIVIDASFSSIRSVSKQTRLGYLGPFEKPVWALASLWYWTWTQRDINASSPRDHIAAIADRPLFLIHGTADGVVPVTEAGKLYEASGRRAELWLVEGAGHSASMGRPEYVQRLRAFYEGQDHGGSTE